MQKNQLVQSRDQREVSFNCPNCRSTRVSALGYARKVGGAVGAVAGVASGAAGILGGAEAGAALGVFAGPLGILVGGLFGAVLGGVAGGVVGCAAGAQLGDVVDSNVLENYRCLSCGYTFGEQGRLD